MTFETLDLSLDIREIRRAAAAARRVCEELGEGPEFVDDVELAVSEAVTNAVRHSRPQAGQDWVRVQFQAGERELTVRVEDGGPGFDPERLPAPDPAVPRESGYGWMIIKAKMDEAKVERSGSRTAVVMMKRRRAGS